MLLMLKNLLVSVYCPTIVGICIKYSPFVCYFVKGFERYFMMEINHGGFFSKAPIIKYNGDKVTYIENVEIEEFSIYELNVVV